MLFASNLQTAVMVAASFLPTLFLSLAVAAEPVEKAESLTKLLLTRRVGANANRDIVNLDRLRVNKIMGCDIFDVASSSADSVNASVYLATVGVGCPPTNCKCDSYLVADEKNLTCSSFHR